MGEETEIANAVPQVAFKKRSKGKANFRKKPATPPPASDSDSDFNSCRIIHVNWKSAPRKRTITGVPAPLTSSNDATKASNWYDENLSEKNLLGTTREKPTSSASQPDGTYKGAANYQSFIQKNPDAPGKFGPLKAATNVRTITVTDFAPDVCKDWKQTGYCGFGDSCKYLHSREAYKAGWELDRDWEVNTKGKQLSGRVVSQRKGAGKIAEEEDDDDEDELLESIPFACIICLKSTYQCGHYFCEACALQRYRKTPSCAACGEGTGGVFNVAKKLKTLLNKKRERARKIREEAIANGEDVSDLEEGDDRD
ncbi:hypothetical protein PDIDSM_3191 [Penicillium digitatum]|nr:hypothetical protein PDIDSM_3191 [Penicillium digitatum]